MEPQMALDAPRFTVYGVDSAEGPCTVRESRSALRLLSSKCAPSLFCHFCGCGLHLWRNAFERLQLSWLLPGALFYLTIMPPPLAAFVFYIRLMRKCASQNCIGGWCLQCAFGGGLQHRGSKGP